MVLTFFGKTNSWVAVEQKLNLISVPYHITWAFVCQSSFCFAATECFASRKSIRVNCPRNLDLNIHSHCRWTDGYFRCLEYHFTNFSSENFRWILETCSNLDFALVEYLQVGVFGKSFRRKCLSVDKMRNYVVFVKWETGCGFRDQVLSISWKSSFHNLDKVFTW